MVSSFYKYIVQYPTSCFTLYKPLYLKISSLNHPSSKAMALLPSPRWTLLPTTRRTRLRGTVGISTKAPPTALDSGGRNTGSLMETPVYIIESTKTNIVRGFRSVIHSVPTTQELDKATRTPWAHVCRTLTSRTASLSRVWSILFRQLCVLIKDKSDRLAGFRMFKLVVRGGCYNFGFIIYFSVGLYRHSFTSVRITWRGYFFQCATPRFFPVVLGQFFPPLNSVRVPFSFSAVR